MKNVRRQLLHRQPVFEARVPFALGSIGSPKSRWYADSLARSRIIRAGLAKAGFMGVVLRFEVPAKGNATKNYDPYDSVLKLSNVKRIGVAPRPAGDA